jgi:hypothetical protein
LRRPQVTSAASGGAGNLLISDLTDNRVRVVAGRTGTFYGQAMTAGDIYTIAGEGLNGSGPALQANIGEVIAIAADRSGNLVIGDLDNKVVVVAESTGTF